MPVLRVRGASACACGWLIAALVTCFHIGINEKKIKYFKQNLFLNCLTIEMELGQCGTERLHSVLRRRRRLLDKYFQNKICVVI